MSGKLTVNHDPEKVKQIVDGLLTFREALTGRPFYAYQQIFAQRVITSLLMGDGASITGLWSRQSGKTTGVGDIGITLAIMLPVLAREFDNVEGFDFLKPYREGLRIGIFAPVKDQAGLSYGKMREIAHSDRCVEILNDPELAVTINTSRGDCLSFSHGSLIHAKTASPEARIEGHTYHLIIIDEAQAVDRFKVEKEIEPMRASTNGTMVKIGTAWVSRGGFHSDIEYNVESFRLGGPRNHFEFDYTIVIAEKTAAYVKDRNPFHLAYEQYVDSQRKKLGEDSLAFRMNFRLKWQDAQLDAISARALLGAEFPSLILNRLIPKPEGFLRVAGLDVAKVNDSTVLTIADVDMKNPVTVNDEGEYYHKYIVGLFEFQGEFENTAKGDGQYQRIAALLMEWGVRVVCIDATGMGDPIYERFKVLCPDVDWIAFKYNLAKKSDLFKHFLDEWDGGRIHIAAGERSKDTPQYQQFFEQHRNLEKEFKGGQYLVCHAPQPTSLRTRKLSDFEYHDDYPNSNALMCWAAKEGEQMGEIEVDNYQVGRNTGPQMARYMTAGRARYQAGRR